MHPGCELWLQDKIPFLLHDSDPNDDPRHVKPVYPGHYPAIREILPARREHAPELQEGLRVVHEGLEGLYTRKIPVPQNQGEPADPVFPITG